MAKTKQELEEQVNSLSKEVSKLSSLKSCVENGHTYEFNSAVWNNGRPMIQWVCRLCKYSTFKIATKKQIKAIEILGLPKGWK